MDEDNNNKCAPILDIFLFRSRSSSSPLPVRAASLEAEEDRTNSGNKR
jgi:hypothetical protein